MSLKKPILCTQIVYFFFFFISYVDLFHNQPVSQRPCKIPHWLPTDHTQLAVFIDKYDQPETPPPGTEPWVSAAVHIVLYPICITDLDDISAISNKS